MRSTLSVNLLRRLNWHNFLRVKRRFVDRFSFAWSVIGTRRYAHVRVAGPAFHVLPRKNTDVTAPCSNKKLNRRLLAKFKFKTWSSKHRAKYLLITHKMFIYVACDWLSCLNMSRCVTIIHKIKGDYKISEYLSEVRWICVGCHRPFNILCTFINALADC